MEFIGLPAVALIVAALPVSAIAASSSPTAVVRAAYACVFSKTCTNAKARAYLTPSFAKDFAEVDALEARCHCEVIDASPWVDAQVGPATFSVGLGTLDGDHATVPVHFSGGKAGAYTLRIDLQRTATGWGISDIRQHDGKSTSAMMRQNVAGTNRYLSTAVFSSPDAVLGAVEKWEDRATMSGSLTRSFADAKPYLTPSFARKSASQLGRVNPFTLSSERATDWESKEAVVEGDRATALVHVQFRSGATSELLYHFERTGGRWAISDITPAGNR